jgi:tRNA-Thr(GGU) m(6)t(6)A37 methyltransferase TsaA
MENHQEAVLKQVEYRPIGIIHSPFKEIENMPIQPTGAVGVKGQVEIFDRYTAGLKDLDGFSHVILIYHFHRSRGFRLQVTPFLDRTEHGLFATRAPKRPNAIGLSIVRLLSVTGGRLELADVDILNGTPVLDIKPYVPQFDAHSGARIGWMEGRLDGLARTRSDDRFQ